MRPLGILLSAMLLPIFICASDDLFPFKLGEDAFSQTVTDWYTVIVSNEVEEIKKGSTDSDIAEICLKRAEKGLNNLSDDEAMLALAKNIYDEIQRNKAVEHAFLEAKQATEKKESLEKRTEAWRTFGKSFAQQLDEITRSGLPEIRYESSGSTNVLRDFLELNKEVTLTDKQKNWFNACDYVIFTIAEIITRIDPEADSSAHPLYKKSINPQN